MTQHRSVRFMPMAGHAANAPPPVFSPTQAETQPSLLHSVFSLQQHPTAQRAPQTEAERAADAAFRAQLSKSIDYSLGGEEYLPEAHNTQANDTVEETADRQMPFRGMAIDTTHHRSYPGMAVISTTRSPSPRRPGGIRQVGGFAIENISPLSTTTNRDRDVFFSPQASLADLTSPTSVNTFKTTTSFKTLPDVTMLDVDNINECESVKSLEHIIEFLDAEGTFQALLRKARSRLEFVLSKTEAPNRYLVEKPFLVAPKTQPFFPPDKKGPPPPPPPPPKRAVTEIRENYVAANPSGQQAPSPPPVFQQRQPAGQPKSAPPPPPPPPPPIPPPPTQGAPQPVKKMASPPKFTTFVPSAAPRNPTTANTSSENQHYSIQLDSVQEDHSPPKSQELAMQPTRSTVAPEPLANLNDTNESSLVMSLSSSMMDANFNFDEQIESAPVSSKKTLASRTTSLESSSNRRLAGRQSPSQAYHHDKSLSEELKRLTETVLNMETARAADRKLFLDKLMSLDEQQNRNGNGGNNLKSIEGMMEKSVASTCELLSSMEQLRRESHELQENVKKERYSWNRTYEEAQHLESRLYQKAEELTLQLTNIPLAANEANVAKAQEMRAQYEVEMARKDRENKELANNLRDTLEGLLVSLGRNKNEVSRMTRVEQKTLVSSFAKQQLSSKAAMEAIAQEAARLERDRSEASRAAQTIKVQLEKSKKAQLQLEHENFELCEKIQELTEELSDMRIKMQELSTNCNSEQEKKYQDIIRTLKDQLRKEETMVSVGLYKAAVDSARDKSSEIERKHTELQTLRKKYSSLSQELEQKELSHKETLDTRYQEANEQEYKEQKIKQLESELLRERQSKEAAAEAAKESLNKLQGKVDDLKFELQESGNMKKSPSPRCAEAESSSSQPVNKPSPPMTPKPTISTPLRVVCNKENTLRSPLTGSKTPGRKFDLVHKSGGVKGLRQRLQQRRSPRAQPTFAM